ncbi:protein-export membrane protein SecD [Candidatus Adlerbacteria bacterium RIFCSPHIGHO2_12_FULL_53_18]|uniref:Protein translocase subunit SecD n=1 Tax=Candidatus Adlerbacteria bacterium RIFCSPHIGHO2_12_FULL_53_18 TaxID=1797242 RepID=A0A1F4XU46_9BACT|nr:MAG: protein-export membrane protein SecD [Candidatus Adlerbacteria bacterium RIFCSPHIGHO2_12_FULL_53_18]
MFKVRYSAVTILILSALVGYFVWTTTGTDGRFDFKLGLDLSGGTHLVYSADISKVPAAEVQDSLASLREVIERRVNAFGVGEPVVQTQQGGALGTGEHRLVVELPGVTDVDEAVKMIGETPLLEFKLVKQGMESALVDETGNPNPDAFTDTGLTGALLSRAALEFGSGSQLGIAQPVVRVDFNSEGSKIFSDLTRDNVGRFIAIFLDGNLISAPVVQDHISNGTAIISGNFDADSARELVRNLNLGALPVPIELVSTQTIGATLGGEAVEAGLAAGLIGFVALSIFMILWYRLPGVVAVASLLIYIVFMLALFKLIPVVLTAAGIAAFILSVGLAVDANVLIAERLKEELAEDKRAEEAIREGFRRAWLAIRDTNITHIIAAVILFWFGTSIIKGFALVFGFGVIVSMLSAITISRTFLLALGLSEESKMGHFLLRSGLRK